MTKTFSTDYTTMTLSCPSGYTPDKITHTYCGGGGSTRTTGVWEINGLGHCMGYAIQWWSERYLRFLSNRYDFQYSTTGDACRYVQSSSSKTSYIWYGAIASEDLSTSSRKSITVSWNSDYTTMFLTLVPNSSGYLTSAFDTNSYQAVSSFVWNPYMSVQCHFWE